MQKCRKHFFNATCEVEILGDCAQSRVLFDENNVISMTNIHVKIEDLAIVLFQGVMSSIRWEHELGDVSWPCD